MTRGNAEFFSEGIDKIIQAIKDKALPKTSGFFFGESDGSEDEESIKILSNAKKWLDEKDPDKNYRSVYYQASW